MDHRLSNAAEKQAGFTVGYVIDGADLSQDAIEISEAARVNIRYYIPFAIACVECLKFGKTAQFSDYLSC